jgi:hypothetical protein
MARHAFDSGDHFFVGNIVSGAHEGGVPPVYQDGLARISVPSKSHEELGAFRLVQWSELHSFSPY